MPRPSKGPRLYLRKGRVHTRTGQAIPDVWYIRDGSTEISTGCGPDGLHGPDGAEAALAAYIERKVRASVQARNRTDGPLDPSDVLIAEVLELYARERAPHLSDPVSVAGWIRALLDFFDGDSLADVKRSRCQAYVADRCSQPIKQARRAEAMRTVTPAGARRELEVLSAAIGYFAGEHTLTARPKVWLPEKSESPRDALTRSQAAALLKAALGYRRLQNGSWERLQASTVANRRHLRRFILIGLYTGTRPGVITKLLWEESPIQAWVDLERETIYRRGKMERDSRTKRRPLVRMPNRLLAHMRRWSRLDTQAMADRRTDDRPTTNAVIHHGGRNLAGRIRTGFAAIVADAGLDPAITPHWMRHTCATWLMERDERSWDAAGYLGMTPQMLESNYGHHRPSHQAGPRKRLG